MASNSAWASTLSVATLRAKLLLRQRLGWLTLAAGAALVFLAVAVSRLSFVNSEKIFWDFSLGLVFVCQLGLSIYIGTQLYSEERGRRTLHLLLSSGLSRWQWVLSNVLGISVVLWLMQLIWFVLLVALSYLNYHDAYFIIAAQAMIGMGVEVLIVLFMGLLLSFLLRPLLALISTASLVLVLHSLTSVQRIFADPNVGRYVQDNGEGAFLQIARFLPPLEWLDLKPLVGYETWLAWAPFAGIVAAGLAWAALLAMLCWLRFERMDL